MNPIQLAFNATNAQLRNAPKEVDLKVTELLSFMVDGAERSFSFTQGSWDGRSSFYNTINKSFPAGFVYLVHKELTALGYPVQLICRDHRKHVPPLGPESPIVDEFGNDDPRYDFHLHAMRQVEKHGRGIVQVATGGGKSKIAKLIMARYKRMTLFLTTRGILLYQMKDQLDAINMSTGQIGDGEFSPTRGVNLGMVQTLVQALEEPSLDAEIRAVWASHHRSKNKNADVPREEIVRIATEKYEAKAKRRRQIIKVLEMIEVVIGEEAHEAGGESYFTILQYCKNAHIRVALTATPFMRDSAQDNMRLMAAFGPKLIVITEKMLIERGILAQPYFKFVDSKPHAKLRKSSPYPRCLDLGYTENEHMHADIARDAAAARRVGLPVLALVARKAQGETLLGVYKAAGMRAEFIQGENDMDVRRDALRRLAAGDLDVVIGTTIVDVGVDCPAIGLVQLCGGGKAEVALRQRIGRGLRAKKGIPNIAFIADYSCNLNLTLRTHYRQRRAVIESTPGFVEGILPDGQDFDWSIFERKAA